MLNETVTSAPQTDDFEAQKDKKSVSDLCVMVLLLFYYEEKGTDEKR